MGRCEEVNERQPCYCFAVSGVKHSGKTTLICRLLPLLKEQALRVCVIKHDGHDFEADVPGTDSYKIFHSGADGIVIYSPQKYMAIARKCDPRDGSWSGKAASSARGFAAQPHPEKFSGEMSGPASETMAPLITGAPTDPAAVREMADLLPEADILILEGFKDGHYPTLEVVRRGVSDHTVTDPDTLMAVVTDLAPEELAKKDRGKTLLDLNDPEAVCRFILERREEAAADPLPESETAADDHGAEATDLPLKDIHVKTKLMLTGEEDFFGPGVANLLRNIDRMGSIHAAALSMNMSYSKAWKLVNRAEEQSGLVLLRRVNGGKNGGSSTLTQDGKDFLAHYDQMKQEVARAAEEIFEKHFGTLSGKSAHGPGK